MSNKPVTDRKFHDATDDRCVNHVKAARHKGIKPNPERVCPVCAPAASAAPEESRKRRRSRRPAGTQS